MTKSIAYDKPVRNLIKELNATKHVTHVAYRKNSVTLHHNAGRLSHDGVLSVWKVRPASAHFNVDAQGTVAQFVKVNEYAWSAGNTRGNQESIHIEMANSTLAPNWEVGEVTWKNAARLAGWLFAKVVGARPSVSNFFYHHHWTSTICAGPYMNKIYDRVLKEAQVAYDSFKSDTSNVSQPAPKPPASKKSIAEVAKDVIAGKYGNGADRTRKLQAEGYDPNAVQREVNNQLAGKTTPAKKTVSQIAAEVIAGKWGNGSDRTSRLTKAGYNPSSVQSEVNRLLGAKTTPAKKSVAVIASEVIAGKWGNDPQRSQKLKAAGYDPKAVQAEVNRRF